MPLHKLLTKNNSNQIEGNQNRIYQSKGNWGKVTPNINNSDLMIFFLNEVHNGPDVFLLLIFFSIMPYLLWHLCQFDSVIFFKKDMRELWFYNFFKQATSIPFVRHFLMFSKKFSVDFS